ncbi:hypothetical protein ACHAQA_002827 [Verticillium albo-atrum]
MTGLHRLAGLIALALCFAHVQAKSVFAHFMLSNTEGFKVSDFQHEISLAQEAHIDGFAVNFAMGEKTTDANLPLFFSAAESQGFKLFLSFDYAGNGAWPKATYAASSAYFRRGSQPLVSTFEGPKSAPDWPAIKKETNCFFIPSFSSLGAKKAVALGVADGLFSWAGWAEGPNRKNTEVDASYLDFMKGMPYMMPVSPWFYTNMPGFGKNWLWRGDHTWFDRWTHIWYLQPEFVQIISWNDYGESHYIGPLDERQYTAFGSDRGKSPFNYVRDMPHDGWRDILPYVIDTYKNNITTSGTWETVPDGGIGVYHGSYLSMVPRAKSLSNGLNNWNAWVGSSKASGTISARSPRTLGEQTCVAGEGMKDFGSAHENFEGVCSFSCNFGYCPRGPCTCTKMGLKVPDPKALNIDAWPGPGVTCTFEGLCAFSCNHNYCPSPTCSKDASLKGKCVIPQPMPEPDPEPEVPSEQGCASGKGQGNFEGLCAFSCGRGFCPSPCTCLSQGSVVPPPATSPMGYPLPNSGPDYISLCAFVCSRGYCPPGACTYTAPTIPGGIFKEVQVGADNKVKDKAACEADHKTIDVNDCDKAGNIGVPPWERWSAVNAQKAAEDLMAWWDLITHIRETSDANIIPAWLINAPIAIGWFWGSDHGKATQLPTNYACDKIGKSGCNAISCQDLKYSAVAMVELAFGNLNSFYQKYYDAIGDIEVNIKKHAKDMGDVFVRPQTGNFLGSLKAILGAFDTVFAFTGAGVWERALSAKSFEQFTRFTETAESVRDRADSAINAYSFIGGAVSDHAVY